MKSKNALAKLTVLIGLFTSAGTAKAQDYTYTGTADPQPITLNFTFSGVSYSNSATAVGFISFSDMNYFLTRPSFYRFGGHEISSLSLTVSGSGNPSSNGTFQTSDFDRISFMMPLYLSFYMGAQLVGQSPYGEYTYWGNPTGLDGDFNFFRSTPTAPDAANYFTLATSAGEMMQLTSMGVVPEPSTYAAIFGSLALVGTAIVRRRKKALKADNP